MPECSNAQLLINNWLIMRNTSQNSRLDDIDINLLDRLQTDARITNVALAEAVHLSPAPCLRRVRDLESSGVIRGYVTLLNPEDVGLDISAFIRVSLEKQISSGLKVFEDRIKSYPEVMECYLMTGDSDYLLRVAVSDLKALQHFIVEHLACIPHVSNIRSSITLKQVKYKTALPITAP